MLQISTKPPKRAVLVIFNKINLNILPFFDIEEKNAIQQRLNDGVKIIPYSKQQKTYFLFPLEIDLTTKEDNIHEKLRIQGNTIYKMCKEYKEAELSLEVLGDFGKEYIASILAGINLSDYEFLKYRTKPKGYSLTVHVDPLLVDEAVINELNLIADSVRITKDLVNEPVSFLTATQYSKEIQKIGEAAGFSVTVMDQKEIEAEQMGGVIAVNLGSSAPATFNILEYKPKKHKNEQPLVLVGKGVVFDTGGLSLKPTRNSMDMMKSDMAGSAAVVGAMHAIAKANLPYHVVGLIPAVENRPGYEAICPSDVITMYDGTTVEVLDTDAEGRLILADALHYAKRYKPELVLDFATLTGSAMRAIGKEASVMMGTADKSTKKKLRKAGNSTGERMVEFPLWDEYGDYMKSEIADLKNLGPMDAGAITAGKFLEHFTDYPWMHFDIAGPAYVSSNYNYRGKWATAYGVRLLFKFVQNQCKDDNAKPEKKSRNNIG
ncbi:MAG TPA: leucyl aminopeptidase [Chitinophagales bacterium]|nr:leucyl aminopeptidase [Chitinophagales bacterium]